VIGMRWAIVSTGVDTTANVSADSGFTPWADV
jgi:hypothetical protein